MDALEARRLAIDDQQQHAVAAALLAGDMNDAGHDAAAGRAEAASAVAGENIHQAAEQQEELLGSSFHSVTGASTASAFAAPAAQQQQRHHHHQRALKPTASVPVASSSSHSSGQDQENEDPNWQLASAAAQQLAGLSLRSVGSVRPGAGAAAPRPAANDDAVDIRRFAQHLADQGPHCVWVRSGLYQCPPDSGIGTIRHKFVVVSMKGAPGRAFRQGEGAPLARCGGSQRELGLRLTDVGALARGASVQATT